MEIRHLASLIAIADHGSFSGAARALGTVQSNVSAHISRLEKDLGVLLVERNGGALTDEGVVVVERARRIIHELQDIEADVHSSDTEIEGETRLGSIGTTGRWLMPRLLPALKKAHPLVRAIIYEGGTSSLIPRVLNGELDAAIVHFPVDDPELVLEPLFSEDLVLLVHAKHRWASLETITIAELATEPLLLRHGITRLCDDFMESTHPFSRLPGNRAILLVADDERHALPPIFDGVLRQFPDCHLCILVDPRDARNLDADRDDGNSCSDQTFNMLFLKRCLQRACHDDPLRPQANKLIHNPRCVSDPPIRVDCLKIISRFMDEAADLERPLARDL